MIASLLNTKPSGVQTGSCIYRCGAEHNLHIHLCMLSLRSTGECSSCGSDMRAALPLLAAVSACSHSSCQQNPAQHQAAMSGAWRSISQCIVSLPKLIQGRVQGQLHLAKALFHSSKTKRLFLVVGQTFHSHSTSIFAMPLSSHPETIA